jgi:integrase
MTTALGVPTRAVMQVMGWSHAAMTTRYQHVPDEVLHGIAEQLAKLLWTQPAGGAGSGPVGVKTPTDRDN